MNQPKICVDQEKIFSDYMNRSADWAEAPVCSNNLVRFIEDFLKRINKFRRGNCCRYIKLDISL